MHLLLSLLNHILLLVVEEDQGEDEDSGHHAEGRGVVGVGLPNEPLVLVMAQRDHRDLEIGEMSKKDWMQRFCGNKSQNLSPNLICS